jgi:hypothetical protein
MLYIYRINNTNADPETAVEPMKSANKGIRVNCIGSLFHYTNIISF